MIVLVSLIVSLRELLVSTIFRMVHPYIAIYSVVYYSFSTLSLYVYSYSGICSNGAKKRTVAQSKLAL